MGVETSVKLLVPEVDLRRVRAGVSDAHVDKSHPTRLRHGAVVLAPSHQVSWRNASLPENRPHPVSRVAVIVSRTPSVRAGVVAHKDQPKGSRAEFGEEPSRGLRSSVPTARLARCRRGRLHGRRTRFGFSPLGASSRRTECECPHLGPLGHTAKGELVKDATTVHTPHFLFYRINNNIYQQLTTK